ncbi:hypothetical protein HG537_0A02190 [Torulaspora globosa]|uniref:Amino acid transporter transmembrane domain-containing protein n=1 Tax=Torulaspora globosa TaxID=48254 RepID=A0A7H9HNS2_9SACH|nr:hypothetical protein HG537_0A02190 [Torulaspora sp. CBS 2947]
MDPTGTAVSSTINLVKTILGAGLLAIPFAFRSDGVVVGTLLTLLAAVTSGFGLFILSKSSKTLINPRNSSFFTLCMLTYPLLAPLFDLAMIVQCFGVGLSYLVLIGDLFPRLFGGEANFWILMSALVTVPLCCLKKLDNLRYSSILGLFALAYLSLLVVICFVHGTLFTHDYERNRGEISWFKVYDAKGLMSTFSIIVFAYTGSMNLFSIINELKDNSMRNISLVINRSISISTLVFLTVGIAGYLTFGSNTLGNIILNYDPDSIWVHIGRLCLGTMVMLSFPLLFHPCRIAINNLIVWLEIQLRKEPSITGEPESVIRPDHREATPIRLSIEDEDNESLSGLENTDIESANAEEIQIHRGTNVEHTPFPDFRFYTITAILLFSIYTLALRIRSFAFVLAIVGATGSTSISFTLPGLFGYKLIGTDSLAIGQMVSPRDRFYKRCSALLAWYGVGIMAFSLYVTLKYGTD